MSEASGTSTETTGTVTGAAAAAVVAAPAPAPAPRAGVPVWRVGKPDAFLAADTATARAAVLTIAAGEEVGRHVGARSEGMRCVTHLFESTKPGYRGWVWFATLARVSRGKVSTVNEVGLLPSGDAVLAPAWLPWAERVRPEDAREAEEAEAAYSQRGVPPAGVPEADDAGEVADAGHAGEESADAGEQPDEELQ